MKKSVNNRTLLLHNIRSEYNVGSIFRTSDAAGISKIYLTGYTPAPKDRFDREVKAISKVALGAEKTVSWEYQKNPITLLTRLKKEGYLVIAIEQDARAIDYKKIKIPSRCIFVLGNEVDGVAKEILKIADVIAEIPMRGKKESLNVSVTAGIALFRMLKI